MLTILKRNIHFLNWRFIGTKSPIIQLLKYNLIKMLGKLKKRKRLRVHGFLKRSSTPDGRNVLKSRRRK
jgi:ribosomal protein L34